MLLNEFLRSLNFLVFICFVCIAQADQTKLRAFTFGSYQQILVECASQPFMLVIWSLTCPSCVKDMALLNELRKNRPDLKIVMVATDEISESEQVQELLVKNTLTGVENWIYAEDNTQKLNYEIDPQWYGELPRTYFFDANHQRTGISGVITKTDYEVMFAKILKTSAKLH